MHRIIAGGTGFIGRYLIQRWLAQGIAITVISRDINKVKSLFGDKVKAITWDELHHQSHCFFRTADVVINLAGANIGDARWTPARKQEIISSRVHPTRLLADFCTMLGDKAPPLFNASAIGVYGLDPTFTHHYDENTAIDFDIQPDFVSTVARQWEQTTVEAKAHGVHVINLRFGIVLGRDGGVLKKLALPFKVGLGGKIGSGKQPFTWVHIADVANSIEFLLNRADICGAVNIVAPQITTQAEFAKTLASTLHRPALLSTPEKLLQVAYGEMAEELLLSGQIAVPHKLIEAGYLFKFPRLDLALQDIYT